MAEDRDGSVVRAGATVRILSFSGNWFEELPDGLRADVAGMIGEEFVVDEVDRFGATWVRSASGSSVALCSHEMLVVGDVTNQGRKLA
jgi:hypothetical protein